MVTEPLRVIVIHRGRRHSIRRRLLGPTLLATDHGGYWPTAWGCASLVLPWLIGHGCPGICTGQPCARRR